jgi:hypothetical protein
LDPTKSDRHNIKFVEISTINSSASGSVYLKAPSLRSAPFHEKIEALTFHSPEQCTLLSNAMTSFGVASQLIFGNDEDSQLQWAYEHNVHIVFPEFWKFEILIAQINHFRPSHILISDPYEFDSRLIKMFGSAATKPHITAWAHSRIREEKDWTEFDLVLVTNEGLEATAQRYGARDTMIFLPHSVPFEGIEKNDTSVFSIGIFIDENSLEEHTICMLHTLRDTFQSGLNDQPKSERVCALSIYLAPHIQPPDILAQLTRPLPTTNKHLQEITSSLNAAIYIDNEKNSSTLLPQTIFTLALHNTMIFANSSAKIFDHFLPGSEIEQYKSLSDLINKIDFYRSNNQEYERLIKSARARVLRDHSAKARAYALLTKLGLIVQPTTQPTRTEKQGADRPLETAEPAIDVAAPTPSEIYSSSNKLPVNSAPATPLNEDKSQLLLLIESVDLFTGMELAKAVDRFNQHNPSGALEVLDQLLSRSIYVPGIHLLRAQCITQLEGPTQKWLARNALREELRHINDHTTTRPVIERAHQLLKPLEDDDAQRQLPLKEHLFDECYTLVKDFSTLPKTTLYSIYRRARLMVIRDVPGDLIDIGCGDGGVALLLEMVSKKFSRLPRRVIALDSFTGICSLDESDTIEGKAPGLAGWGKGTQSFSRERTIENFSKLGSDILILPVDMNNPDSIERILSSLNDDDKGKRLDFALIHIDVSTYKPTRHALEAVYRYLNIHGSLVVERGIGIEGVGHAINEFLSENQGDFRFVGEECDTIWIASKKGYGWTDSRVSTFPEYL